MRLLQRSHPATEPTRAADASCAACGKEIEALAGVRGVEVAVNLGGTVLSGITADPIGGVICETCHRTWCTDCWIPMLTGDTDVCTACGTRLVVRTTAHLRQG